MILHAVAAVFAVGELVFSASTWRMDQTRSLHLAASVLMATAMLDMGLLGQTLLRPLGWAAVLAGVAMLVAAFARFTHSGPLAHEHRTPESLELALGLIAMAIIPLLTGVGPNAGEGGGMHQHRAEPTGLAVLLIAITGALLVAAVRPGAVDRPQRRRTAARRVCMLVSLSTMIASTVVV